MNGPHTINFLCSPGGTDLDFMGYMHNTPENLTNLGSNLVISYYSGHYYFLKAYIDFLV